MYESAQRFLEKAADKDECFIFYLGDHDPSGEDMVRDIRDRMELFGVGNLRVDKVALTMDQIILYNPPPNPAKTTDPRAGDYIAKHGDESWEVDALPPNVLQKIIEDSVLDVLDLKLMDQVKRREESDKKKLQKAVEKIDG